MKIQGLALPIFMVLLAFTGGCHRITYRIADASDRTYTVSEWNHFFVAGLVPVVESRSLETLCPGSKILEIKTYTSASNVISEVLSAGMSSGRTLEYTCTFPEDRLARSTGRIRNSILGRLGLSNDARDDRANDRVDDR